MRCIKIIFLNSFIIILLGICSLAELILFKNSSFLTCISTDSGDSLKWGVPLEVNNHHDSEIKHNMTLIGSNTEVRYVIPNITIIQGKNYSFFKTNDKYILDVFVKESSMGTLFLNGNTYSQNNLVSNNWTQIPINASEGIFNFNVATTNATIKIFKYNIFKIPSQNASYLVRIKSSNPVSVITWVYVPKKCNFSFDIFSTFWFKGNVPIIGDGSWQRQQLDLLLNVNSKRSVEIASSLNTCDQPFFMTKFEYYNSDKIVARISEKSRNFSAICYSVKDNSFVATLKSWKNCQRDCNIFPKYLQQAEEVYNSSSSNCTIRENRNMQIKTTVVTKSENEHVSYYWYIIGLILLFVLIHTIVILIIRCRFKLNAKPKSDQIELITIYNYVESSQNTKNVESTQNAKIPINTLADFLLEEYSSGYSKLRHDYQTAFADSSQDIHDKKTIFRFDFLGVENILTTWPQQKKVNDFWAMIWKNNLSLVVVVCEEDTLKKYWPEVGTHVQYKKLTVKLLCETQHPYFIKRKFTIREEISTREVIQLQCTCWPENKLPEYPITVVPFIKEIFQLEFRSLLLHGGLDFGRPGSIFLAYHALLMANQVNHQIDFKGILQSIMKLNRRLIENCDQYIFVVNLVQEVLFCGFSAITVNEVFEQAIQNAICYNEPEKLLDFLNKQNIFRNMYMPVLSRIDVKKIRSRDIIYGLSEQITLSRHPKNDENSTFIAAFPVAYFLSQHKFVVTQQPLLQTIGDFWRMVDEGSADTIVCLNELDLEFWTKRQPVPYLQLIQMKTWEDEDYDFINFLLININTGQSKTISLIRLNGWNNTELIFKCHLVLLTIIKLILTKPNQKTIVMSYDGILASGLFVGLFYVIEQLSNKSIFDPATIIQDLRKHHVDLLKEKEQIQYLYEAALEYHKNRDFLYK